ncbi:MAG: type 4a pilus biogenesis protein PilO [Patescibacteria group bacterium]
MRNSFQIFISFILGILIVFAGAYILFHLDVNQWKSVGEIRIQLAERQAVVKRLNQLIQKFREQLAMFDNLDQQVSLVGKALPTSLKIPELLVSLEAIAQENEVGFSHISFTVLESDRVENSELREFSAPGTGQETGPYPIAITLDGAGNYLGMKKFLQGVETELRLIEVRNLEIIPVKKTGEFDEATTFNFKLNLEAYSIKKPQFTLP